MKHKSLLTILALAAFAPAIFAADVPANTETKADAKPAETEAKPELEKIKGTVASVDKTANTLTVKGEDGKDTVVTVDDKTKIKSKQEKAALADIPTGEKVVVKAKKDGDKWVAVNVRVGEKAEAAKP